MEIKQVRRALLSVTDKTGLVEFARQLTAMRVELISTGGTARALREGGLVVRDVSDLTGFPEMLDGRVKTLHPKVHGGILHRRSSAEHRAAVAAEGIEPIDMVVVNLYAFEETARRPGVSFGEMVENIDIGGPSMVRSAAKNFEDVAVVTAPADYDVLAAEMLANQGRLSLETRWRLARQAFTLTAAYDSAIALTFSRIAAERQNELGSAPADGAAFPPTLLLAYPRRPTFATVKIRTSGRRSTVTARAPALRPHSSFRAKNLATTTWSIWMPPGSWYRSLSSRQWQSSSTATPAERPSLRRWSRPTRKRWRRIPMSAFGSVIGINREMDEALAEEITKLFVEAIAAPSFSEAARSKLCAKKNLRLLIVKQAKAAKVAKQISGGLLLQDADTEDVSEAGMKVVTARQPTPEELEALRFAWRVAKHVKSNAIVYARDGQTIGVGAGQMSRVDAAKFGAMKAVLPLANCVAASDAFFPFADGLEAVAAAGATAVIQPGGSVRDREVIEAADRLGLAMVFTGVRHFRH